MGDEDIGKVQRRWDNCRRAWCAWHEIRMHYSHVDLSPFTSVHEGPCQNLANAFDLLNLERLQTVFVSEMPFCPKRLDATSLTTRVRQRLVTAIMEAIQDAVIHDSLSRRDAVIHAACMRAADAGLDRSSAPPGFEELFRHHFNQCKPAVAKGMIEVECICDPRDR